VFSSLLDRIATEGFLSQILICLFFRHVLLRFPNIIYPSSNTHNMSMNRQTLLYCAMMGTGICTAWWFGMSLFCFLTVFPLSVAMSGPYIFSALLASSDVTGQFRIKLFCRMAMNLFSEGYPICYIVLGLCLLLQFRAVCSSVPLFSARVLRNK
jgi:hypothetical protein